MTWLRWDTDTPRSDRIGLLAEALRIDLAKALGHYFACICGFGEHRRDGALDVVPDSTLEQWAGWTGKPGAFAAAFRQHCRADGTRKDADGTCRGWWRNLAPLAKQERDSMKRRPSRNPRGSGDMTPEKPARVNASDPRETRTGQPSDPRGFSEGTRAGFRREPPKNPRATVRNGTALSSSGESGDLLEGPAKAYLDGSRPEGAGPDSEDTR